MKTVVRLCVLLSVLLFVACATTYDSALIYHKNFISGTHPLLQFQGYYSDTLQFHTVSNPGTSSSIPIRPMYFYANGSVFSADNYVGSNLLPNCNEIKGSWGNYLITADTIQVEKFQLIKNNYTRIITRGTITEGKIQWTSRKEHNESYKPINYTTFFIGYPTKPDSTKNFIRTKEKYNQ